MIAILDYDAGNLTSVELAVRHVGGSPIVTRDPEDVARAERVVFPGVGASASCMANLRRLGLDQALGEAVAVGKPVLAICIGLQLLFDHSDEDGGVDCLGLLSGSVKRFSFPAGKHVKIPHMGWNGVEWKRDHPLLAGIPPESEFYFVHSYFAATPDPAHIMGVTEYEGAVFLSSAARDNLFAAQFHPEKSGEAGLRLLANFLHWDGKDIASC